MGEYGRVYLGRSQVIGSDARVHTPMMAQRLHLGKSGLESKSYAGSYAAAHEAPDHRPDETNFQHAMAMRAYLLLMARAKGVIAATAGAAAYSGLSEDQVRYMLAKDKPAKAPWFKGQSIGVVECAALFLINKRLHNKVRNPPRKKYQRRP